MEHGVIAGVRHEKGSTDVDQVTGGTAWTDEGVAGHDRTVRIDLEVIEAGGRTNVKISTVVPEGVVPGTRRQCERATLTDVGVIVVGRATLEQDKLVERTGIANDKVAVVAP